MAITCTIGNPVWVL